MFKKFFKKLSIFIAVLYIRQILFCGVWYNKKCECEPFAKFYT